MEDTRDVDTERLEVLLGRTELRIVEQHDRFRVLVEVRSGHDERVAGLEVLGRTGQNSETRGQATVERSGQRHVEHRDLGRDHVLIVEKGGLVQYFGLFDLRILLEFG
jgi:hypothetical protein